MLYIMLLLGVNNYIIAKKYLLTGGKYIYIQIQIKTPLL